MIKFKKISELLTHPDLEVIECKNFDLPPVKVAEKETTEIIAAKKQTPKEPEIRTVEKAEVAFVNSLLPELKAFILSTKKELEAADISSESSVDKMHIDKENLDVVEKLIAKIEDNNMENVISSLYNDSLFSHLIGDKLEDHYTDVQCLEHEQYKRDNLESSLSEQEDYDKGEYEYYQSLADENDAIDRAEHESQSEQGFGHHREQYIKAKIGNDTYELSIIDIEDEEGSVYKEEWKMNGELHRYGGGPAKIEKHIHNIAEEKHMDEGQSTYYVKGVEIKSESNLSQHEQRTSDIHSGLSVGASSYESDNDYSM